MPRVTLPFLFSSTNTQLHSIGKPVVVVLIDSGGNADQICLRLSGLAWMFSLSPSLSFSCCPHYSMQFQECLQCLRGGNEELLMVGGSQELIFLSSLFLACSSFFFSFTLCFVCLALDLDTNSVVQLEMSWICC